MREVSRQDREVQKQWGVTDSGHQAITPSRFLEGKHRLGWGRGSLREALQSPSRVFIPGPNPSWAKKVGALNKIVVLLLFLLRSGNLSHKLNDSLQGP